MMAASGGSEFASAWAGPVVGASIPSASSQLSGLDIGYVFLWIAQLFTGCIGGRDRTSRVSCNHLLYKWLRLFLFRRHTTPPISSVFVLRFSRALSAAAFRDASCGWKKTEKRN